MEKEKRELKGAGELRRKAEGRLKEKPAPPEKLAELETQELIEELRVHQIELEMQNEELRRTQAVVEESRAKYSDLYDFAPVGYLTLNRQGIILEANLTACSSLGKERSLLININNLFTNFIIKKEEKGLFYQHLGKVFEAKSLETCELELKGEGDTKFYAQLQSTIVKDNLSQCRTAITDITERKQAEEVVKDTVYRFQAVVESVGEGITFSDSSGKFSVYNLKMQGLTGYTVDEANNSGDFTKLLYPQPLERQKALQRLQEIVEHKVALPLEVETTIQAKDGTKKVLWISTVEMRFKDQEMFLSIYRDITERKNTEEALAKAAKMKSDFTSMVSHELRTPLSSLKEAISIVLDGLEGEINEKQKEILGIANNNLTRLAKFINHVLDLQKLDAGKVEFHIEDNDINALVKEVRDTMFPSVQKKGLDFILQLDENLPKIKFDHDRIVDVLLNLVNNSVKVTEKGSITITTRLGGNFIQISVKDTGLGIKEEDIKRLFRQYEQLERKAGGTGLGLAIAQKTIAAHGGKIWAESIFGQGTTMHFVLPIKEHRG